MYTNWKPQMPNAPGNPQFAGGGGTVAAGPGLQGFWGAETLGNSQPDFGNPVYNQPAAPMPRGNVLPPGGPQLGGGLPPAVNRPGLNGPSPLSPPVTGGGLPPAPPQLGGGLPPATGGGLPPALNMPMPPQRSSPMAPAPMPRGGLPAQYSPMAPAPQQYSPMAPAPMLNGGVPQGPQQMIGGLGGGRPMGGGLFGFGGRR